MTVLTCPSQRQMLDFLLGRLTDEQARAIEDHVPACTACQAVLIRFDAVHDPLLRQLRQASASDPLLAEEELQQLLPRLEHLATPHGHTTVDEPRAPARSSHPGDLESGSCLGRYRIVAKLGQGGMGAVYKAHDPQLNRTVAVKVPRFDRERPDHGVSVQRFLREARLAAGVRHAHVCPVHDVGEHDGSPFVVMALIEGQSLGDLIKGERLEVSRAVELVRKVALGLEAVHAQGLVHRDLKPANILIDGAGEPLLTDFGLARPVTDEEHLTREGAVVGTPAFMVPEQALNETAKIGPWTDVYSLGVVLYRLLTGKQPFDGPPLTMMFKIAHESPPVPTTLRPELDAALEAIVLKAMAKKPEERYRSARELAKALAAWSAKVAHPAAGSATETLLPTPKPVAAPRRKWGWRLLGAAAVLLALLPAGVWLAVTVLRVQTPTGELVVQVDDADVEVAVVQKEVVVEQKSTKREFHLQPVDGEVQVFDKETGLKLLTKRFTLTKGGKETVIVTAAELADAKPKEPQSSPLDRLDPAKIPEAEGFGWQPKELVAVLGSHKGRHWGQVVAVVYSPDGKFVASAGRDHVIRLWDPDTLEERAVLKGHTDQIRTLAVSPDGKTLASGGHEGDGTVRLWKVDGHEAKAIAVLKPGGGWQGAGTFAPDGKKLAVGNQNGTASIWNMGGAEPGKQPDRRLQIGYAVRCLAFSPDSTTLACVYADFSVHLLDLTDKEPRERAVLKGHKTNPLALAFSPDGKMLVSGSDDGVRVWDLSRAEAEGIVISKDYTSALAFTPDGKTPATSSEGWPPLLWDMTGPQPKEKYRLPERTSGNALAFSPSGTQLFVGSHAGVEMFDLSQPQPRLKARQLESQQGVWSVAFTPDGKTLASGHEDGAVRLWDMSGAEPHQRATLEGHPEHKSAVRSVAISADGNLLAFGHMDTVQLWRLTAKDPAYVRRLLSSKGSVGSVAIASDGKTLAAGDGDGDIMLWALPVLPEQQPVVFNGHRGLIDSLGFTPDGKTLVSACNPDGTIRLWNLAEGEAKERLVLKHPRVTTVAIAPDGKTLFSASHQAQSYFWDLTEAEPKGRRVEAWNERAYASTFAQDGKTVARASLTLLDLLDSRSAKAQREWSLPGVVSGVAYAPDGRHLAVGNANGTIYILRLAPPP